jgi:hypothetical protein
VRQAALHRIVYGFASRQLWGDIAIPCLHTCRLDADAEAGIAVPSLQIYRIWSRRWLDWRR